MKYCPECDANVEGIVHHCDCCGALLSKKKISFIGHLKSDVDDWDLYYSLKKVIRVLGKGRPHGVACEMDQVMFAIFCFPQEKIRERGMKEGMRYLESKQTLSIVIVVDHDAFLGKSRNEKEQMICDAICSNLAKAAQVYSQKIPGIDKIFSQAVCNLSKSTGCQY